MQFGPTIYKECPQCYQLVDYSTISSGNTFGATHWTDGKMDAPMLPDSREVGRCPKCLQIFWLEDAELIGTHDWFNGDTSGKPVGAEKAKSVGFPDTADFFVEALQTGLGNSRMREEYLRVRLWWMSNDPVRKGERSTILPPVEEELYFKNLKQLSKLLEENNDADPIMHAEIARECGEFEKCIVRLTVVPEEYASVCEQIRKLAQDKNRVVQKLKM